MDDKKFIVVGHGTRAVRGFYLVVGETYVIQPLNPKKLKNRNREIVVIEILNDEDDGLVLGTWIDNRRKAKIESSELFPINPSLKIDLADCV